MLGWLMLKRQCMRSTDDGTHCSSCSLVAGRTLTIGGRPVRFATEVAQLDTERWSSTKEPGILDGHVAGDVASGPTRHAAYAELSSRTRRRGQSEMRSVRVLELRVNHARDSIRRASRASACAGIRRGTSHTSFDRKARRRRVTSRWGWGCKCLSRRPNALFSRTARREARFSEVSSRMARASARSRRAITDTVDMLSSATLT